MANIGKRRAVTTDGNNKIITVNRKSGAVKKQKTIKKDGESTTIQTVKYRKSPSKNPGRRADAANGSVTMLDGSTHQLSGKIRGKEGKRVVTKDKGVGANNPIRSIKTKYKY